MTLRLRHLAWVNPTVTAFDELRDEQELTFLPLEAVWADDRLDLSRVRTKGEVKTGYVRFHEGDVLIPKTAPTFEHARTAIATTLVNGVGAGSSELHVLRARPGNDARYLAYTARSATFLAQGVGAYEGVAGLKRVPPEFIADWPVRELSGDEQRRIADFLDHQVALLDRATSLRQQQIDLAQERTRAEAANALAGMAVASGLRPHPLIGPTNADWPVRRLKHVLRDAGVGVVVNPSSYFVEDDGVPFIHGGNVRDGHFELAGVKRISEDSSRSLSRSRLCAGDVVVVRAGYPGRAAVVPPELAGANCASVLLLRPGPTVLPEWVETFFNARQGRSQVGLVQYGAAQEQINLGDVVEFALPVPTVATQQQVLRDLTERRAVAAQLAELHAQSLRLLRERKTSLITAAVAGDFDVTTARSVAR